MSVKENYQSVLKEVEESILKSGRVAGDVTLIAVSKTKPVELLQEVYDCGCRDFGENKVQEIMDKYDVLPKDIRRHMIGHLQTNKVKYIVGNGALIQSLDRMELAREISRIASNKGVIQDTLVEVNIGGEAQKGGISTAELIPFLELVSAMPSIRVKGLMCVPPAVGQDEARRYFARMRRLFEDIRGMNMPDVDMLELSMGMSGDYKAAVLEGATMVRVGTGIFGARPTAGAGA